jgi:uncharacterized protein (TIGR00730 family)
MKRVTVFCGSSAGHADHFRETARKVGQTLASLNIGVVYGGAKVGLMGAVADGALEAGGEVIGVLPRFLRSVEIEHTGLTDLILVDSMHERKARMDDMSNGVIALPGGFGTLEELFEMLTWAQLGLHRKPVALLNTEGFYDGLIAVLENMVATGFLKSANQQMLIVDPDIHSLIRKMMSYQAPHIPKWITKNKT